MGIMVALSLTTQMQLTYLHIDRELQFNSRKYYCVHMYILDGYQACNGFIYLFEFIYNIIFRLKRVNFFSSFKRNLPAQRSTCIHWDDDVIEIEHIKMRMSEDWRSTRRYPSSVYIKLFKTQTLHSIVCILRKIKPSSIYWLFNF